MLIKLSLCTVFAFVCSYNVDTRFPIIVSNRSPGLQLPTTSGTYLGYSVLLHSIVDRNQSWVFVGAPRANHSNIERSKVFPKETGAVYQCTMPRDNDQGTSCNELYPSVIENEEGFNKGWNERMLIKKQGGWLGAAMSINKKYNFLTVCAPRTTIRMIHTKEETMHGVCYTTIIPEHTIHLEDKNCETYDFGMRFWYDPGHGFSIHYASVSTVNTTILHRVVGEPKHDMYGKANVVHYKDYFVSKGISITLPNLDEMSLFGYSVTSGCFFRKAELLIASGAPGWRYVGQVGILNDLVTPHFIASLRGTEVGAYFGASLASGDVNNDGLDDLLVGAPHSGNDGGRVFLYLGNARKKFVTTPSLRGMIDGGQFGYSIACGDLDADGFADIIVGAPWEDNGVIYIYNGAANLGQEIGLQESQRISAADTQTFNTQGLVKGFGFSISEPVDIDANGYLDIAVGAYKSGHALVLRGNSVVTTVLKLYVFPDILERSSKLFTILACSAYEGDDWRDRDFMINFTLDESHRRTEYTHLELLSSDFVKVLKPCVYANVTLLDRIRDFIEPIVIEAKHTFINERAKEQYCKTCPVENRNNKMNVARRLLTFEIGCGEDTVCNAEIVSTVTFHGVQDEDTWVIGSGGISLAVNLMNLGEPAYLTNLVFTLPEKIILRSILRSCQEDQGDNNLIVTCDVGNPLAKGEKKEIKLDLDMKYLNNGSMHGSELKFLASLNSQSTNHGVNEIEKVLNLVADASLSLNGQANEESYYLSAIDKDSVNITFQHVYQIYKLGMTPVDEARFTVKVPTVIQNWGTFVHVYQPQLIVAGEIYKCSTGALFSRHRTSQYQSVENVTEVFQDSTIVPNEISSRSKRIPDINWQDEATVLIPPKSGTNQDIVDPLHPTEIVNINCTSPNITCSIIVCNINSLRSLTDTGKLVLKLILERDALKVFQGATTEDTKIFRLTSDAQVEIIAPNNIVTIDETRSAINVTTIFYSAPKHKVIQWWVIILSVSVGLFLLLIIIIVLSVLGFFKRDSKQELDALKSKEINLEDTNENNDHACTTDEDA